MRAVKAADSLVLIYLLICTCRALPALEEAKPIPEAVDPRKIHGRFLHITDLHPDPFFKTYSSTEEDDACHRGSGPAGYYGAETSACDSPISLVNATFKWIEHNLKDEIDFVIWTGDSARHDNDEEIPRTEDQILEQNTFLVSKFLEVFGKPENYDDNDPTNDIIIPVIPTLGNNDIMPHNILEPGENWWTKKYVHIWRQFIPQEQRHQFEHGGWFYVEVIPNKLAVLSLNTMYFYNKNSAVDGCAAKSQPGYDHMEWLRIQLGLMRTRGMKAILIGHVPPARTESKNSWDETCWQKYTLWMRQFRDVVVGSLYGHMNIDHFMLQDFEDIDLELMTGVVDEQKRPQRPSNDDGYLTIASTADYLASLRADWGRLSTPPRFRILEEQPDGNGWSVWTTFCRAIGLLRRETIEHTRRKDKHRRYLDKIGGEWAERFSMSHVSPSVVPNYFPSLRLFHYNITGLDVKIPVLPTADLRPAGGQFPLQNSQEEHLVSHSGEKQRAGGSFELESRDRLDEAIKGHKKPKFTVPDPPSKSAPPGPAYSPQTLTLLGYTQYFANLTHVNNDSLHESLDSGWKSNPIIPEKWKKGKHHGKHPKKGSKPHPKGFAYEVEYATSVDDAYGLKDLTLKNYVDLAWRIGADISARTETMSDYGLEESPVHVDDDPELSSDDTVNNKNATQDSSWRASPSPVSAKKHKKGKKRKRKEQLWYTFVERAFVGSMEMEDIKDQFS